MSEYLKIIFLNEFDDKEQYRKNYRNRVTPFASSEIYFASIKSAEILTKGEDIKTVYKLTLNLKNINYNYLPGDTIGILPQNNETLIKQIFTRLNIEIIADKPCKLLISEQTTKKNPIIPKHLPVQSTLRDIFLNHVDIFTPPKKVFLKSLIKFTQDTKEIEKLQLITSPKGSKKYIELINGSGGTLFGLLETFPSCNPPIEVILEYLPPLLPRPYSISSSPLRDQLDLTFFISYKNERKGLCTGWLEDLITNKIDEFIPFYFRQTNNFRLVEDLSIPLILIATGTGIAPFRSFLQHRSLQNVKKGNIWLIYGCRYSNRDYLFKREIEEHLKCGILTKLDLAFSREQEEKIYVQNCIDNKGEEFIDWLLKKDAILYICGDLNTVVKDVKSSIVKNLIKYNNMNESDSEYFLKEMQSRKKIIIDTWI